MLQQFYFQIFSLVAEEIFYISKTHCISYLKSDTNIGQINLNLFSNIITFWEIIFFFQLFCFVRTKKQSKKCRILTFAAKFETAAQIYVIFGFLSPLFYQKIFETIFWPKEYRVAFFTATFGAACMYKLFVKRTII